MSMNHEDLKFLAEVAKRAKTPGMLQAVISAAIEGLAQNTEEIRNHAVDMEVVASMAMNTRLFKGNEKFLADKLEGWKHRHSLRWDDQIAKLKEKDK